MDSLPPELGNPANLEILTLDHNQFGRDAAVQGELLVPEEIGNRRNLTVILISPQSGWGNPCIPAKLKGRLRTDLPSHYELTPFREE